MHVPHTLKQSLSQLGIPALAGPGKIVRIAWDRLSTLPYGTRAFSRIVGRMAPYTGSIGAEVVELSRGRAKVMLRDRPRVRNHLRSVHAIALANLAELAGNIAVVYTLPDDARFIVAGMSIDYIKKARGTLHAIGRCPDFRNNKKCEVDVSVEIFDSSEELVATATLKTLVGPVKKAA